MGKNQFFLLLFFFLIVFADSILAQYVCTTSVLDQINNSDPQISAMNDLQGDVFVSQIGSGTYAFVTFNAAVSSSEGLAVIDVSNPSNLDGVGIVTNSDPQISQLFFPSSVFVQGNFAYVTGASGDNLSIINISNPSSPDGVGQISNTTVMDQPSDVFVLGNYAYVTGNDSDTFAIIDVSNPSAPSLESVIGRSDPQISAMDGPTGVFVSQIGSGTYAFVVNEGTDSFSVIDVSNPSSPDGIAQITGNGFWNPSSISVSGNYAYIPNLGGSQTLIVVDISTPSNPQKVASMQRGDDPYMVSFPNNIFVSGNHAFLTTAYTSNTFNPLRSFAIVDISDPLNPDAIHRGLISGTPTGIFVLNQSIFITEYATDSLLSYNFDPVCTFVCGDGFAETSEQCDDGNTNPGDGCSATCQIEPQAALSCSTPFDLLFVLDNSGSMDETDGTGTTRLDNAKTSISNFVNLLDSGNADFMAGLVNFNTTASLAQGLTNDPALIDAALAPLTAGGNTKIGEGIRLAQNEINSNGRIGARHAIIVLSDSYANLPTTPYGWYSPAIHTRTQAGIAKADGTIIYSISVAVEGDELLTETASSPAHFFRSITAAEIDEAYQDIQGDICICGDSVVTLPETCDDGSTNPGDGCSDVCLIEACGDGIVDPDGPDNNPFTPADNEDCDPPNGSTPPYCDSTCNFVPACPLPNQPNGPPYKMKLVSGNNSASGPNLFFGVTDRINNDDIDYDVLAEVKPPIVPLSGSYSMDFALQSHESDCEECILANDDLNINIADLKDDSTPLQIIGNPKISFTRKSDGSITPELDIPQENWNFITETDNIDLNIHFMPLDLFPMLNDTDDLNEIRLRFDVVCDYCGDGVTQPSLGETCDPPTPGSCDTSCHIIGGGGSVCGNGSTVPFLEPGEQCELGNFDPNALCDWGIQCNTTTNCICPVGPFCPDNTCDAVAGETCSTCPQDCGACPVPIGSLRIIDVLISPSVFDKGAYSTSGPNGGLPDLHVKVLSEASLSENFSPQSNSIFLLAGTNATFKVSVFKVGDPDSGEPQTPVIDPPYGFFYQNLTFDPADPNYPFLTLELEDHPTGAFTPFAIAMNGLSEPGTYFMRVEVFTNDLSNPDDSFIAYFTLLQPNQPVSVDEAPLPFVLVIAFFVLAVLSGKKR